MLETGHLDIASIAAAAGFVDQSHLYRHFRRLLGVTPGEYARRFAPGCAPVKCDRVAREVPCR
jgi:transcriptional regulator GlxA family with amidase domain